MISAVLIGGLVEIGRALLYMPRNGLNAKESFRRPPLKSKVCQASPSTIKKRHFLWDTLYNVYIYIDR